MEKEKIKERQEQILDLVREFCSKKLDDDYFEICERLIKKLGRKKQVPFASGQVNVWAAAVVHAVGSINFLFDKSFMPYVSVIDLNDFFGTKKATTSAKSTQLRNALKLSHWDSGFSTRQMKDSNPFAKLVMVDGLIVPLDSLPEDVQMEIRRTREAGGDIVVRTT